MKKVLKLYSETCSPCKLMGKRLAEIENIEGVSRRNEKLQYWIRYWNSISWMGSS